MLPPCGSAPRTLNTMPTALLRLGSNLQPQQHLHAAVEALRARFGAIAVSPAYRTAAVGFDGPDFLNNAVAIETDLPLQTHLCNWPNSFPTIQSNQNQGGWLVHLIIISPVTESELELDQPAFAGPRTSA